MCIERRVAADMRCFASLIWRISMGEGWLCRMISSMRTNPQIAQITRMKKKEKFEPRGTRGARGLLIIQVFVKVHEKQLERVKRVTEKGWR